MKFQMTIAAIMLVLIVVSGCTYGEFTGCTSHEDCDEDEGCEFWEGNDYGECHRCGDNEGRVCCRGQSCDEGLVCIYNECRPCGTRWEHCCEGEICAEGLDCEEGTCHGCGTFNEKCCEGDVCTQENACCYPDGTCKGCEGVPGWKTKDRAISEGGDTAQYGSGTPSRG